MQWLFHLLVGEVTVTVFCWKISGGPPQRHVCTASHGNMANTKALIAGLIKGIYPHPQEIYKAFLREY